MNLFPTVLEGDSLQSNERKEQKIGDCMSPGVLCITTIFLLCPHMAFLPYVHLEQGLESLPSLTRALVPSWGSTLMTSFSPNYVSKAPP